MAIGLIFFLGFCIVIILPFTVLIISLIIKGRNQAWKGTIVDKLESTNTDMDDHTTTNFIVVVQIDNGREAKIAVDKSRYDNWEVGDRLEKVKGESWPQKISSDS